VKDKVIEPIYLLIGAKLVHMRTTLGISQEELAKKIGLTRTSITNIEAGRQRVLLHDVEKIAAAFGISPKHLLKGIWT
jgi:transcriptional regulator with XRE-family HTH domain